MVNRFGDFHECTQLPNPARLTDAQICRKALHTLHVACRERECKLEPFGAPTRGYPINSRYRHDFTFMTINRLYYHLGLHYLHWWLGNADKDWVDFFQCTTIKRTGAQVKNDASSSPRIQTSQKTCLHKGVINFPCSYWEQTFPPNPFSTHFADASSNIQILLRQSTGMGCFPWFPMGFHL